MTTGPLRLTVEHNRPFRVDSTRTPVTTVGPFGVDCCLMQRSKAASMGGFLVGSQPGADVRATD